MSSLITKSIRLKAEAYQVMRFGQFRPQKPLTRAIARRVIPVRALDRRAAEE